VRLLFPQSGVPWLLGLGHRTFPVPVCFRLIAKAPGPFGSGVLRFLQEWLRQAFGTLLWNRRSSAGAHTGMPVLSSRPAQNRSFRTRASSRSLLLYPSAGRAAPLRVRAEVANDLVRG